MNKQQAQAKYAALVDAGKADAWRKSPAARYVDYDDPAFVIWLHNVDRAVQGMIGLSVFDLADFPSRDLYDAGEDSRDAARAALDEDDLPWEMAL